VESASGRAGGAENRFEKVRNIDVDEPGNFRSRKQQKVVRRPQDAEQVSRSS
jgi:hypothetical protein